MLTADLWFIICSIHATHPSALISHTHYTPPYLMHTTHRNIVFKAPYPVQEQPQEVLHTYLDTVGRPVFIATKSNLVEQHIVDFEVGNGSAPNLMCPTPTFPCPYLPAPLPSCPYLPALTAPLRF